MMETLRFKNDGLARKRLFVEAAMAHPAKGHIALWQEMIERYTKPGDLVLDPLAGIGTSLVAALMGRNVICVELEPHFVAPMKASWAKMQGIPMLGYTMGQAVILRGDARALPLCSADAVLTSPPYEASEVAQSSDGEANRRFRAGEYTGDALRGMGLAKGYTRPAAILTSPPFQDQKPFNDKDFMLANGKGNNSPYRPVGQSRPSLTAYSASNGENIGNLRGDAYWASMRQVYGECHRVLRPGGILALVLKGFTRDGLYVDLPGQTEALLLAAGWEKHDEWRRQLWSLSFWRTLQKRRDPSAFDDRLNFEEVLAFRKPEGGGDGVAAVLTSPPYEGIVGDNKEGPSQTSVPGGWKAGTVNKHGGYTQPSAILTSPPYEGSVAEGPSGIDWTQQADGRKKQEPHGVGSHPWGYTRPSAIITSPPYEGTLQGDEPTGKLFETERRVNSPASGNRRSKRKPLGGGYTKD